MIVTLVLFNAVVVLLSVFILWRRRKHFQMLEQGGIPTPDAHWLTGHLDHVTYSPGKFTSTSCHFLVYNYPNFPPLSCRVRYYNGGFPRVLVADLDMLRDILVKDAHNFVNRPVVISQSKMLIALRDQHWKDVRKIMSPVFSTAKMKKMMPLMSGCVEVLLQKCHQLAASGQEFDIYVTLQCLTMDVIDRCAITLGLQCINNPENEVLENFRRLFNRPPSLVTRLMHTFPSLLTLLSTAMRFAGAGLHRHKNAIVDHLRRVVKERREQQGHAGVEKSIDALQMLIDASCDGKQTSGKTTLSEQEVVDNAFLFLAAGFETTSNALSYIAHLLALHPGVQEQLFQEVTRVVQAEGGLTYETLAQLVYTEAVAMEAMRMYPPVTGFVLRETARPWTRGAYTFPAKSEVEVPVWSIHNDPLIYPDPHLFKPERFLPEEKKNRHPMAFLAFGTGPRNCLGIRFAMMEIKLTLGTIIQNFRFKTCSRTKVPLPLVTRGALTHPQDGVWLTLEPRAR
ncbi:cytochrome P450 3A29-like [Penaeus japonicus]|uniref:cytochrome P450 3A29-like n=1 Tax=Penaeus japonicus TaxID=27405 RepID=UPI001C70F96A|nr:cytochrome P450 3A29-like [Penaeus japonicus]